MGAGRYSYDTAMMRSASYAKVSREEIFSKRTMDSQMNPKNVVRECCENDEHPDTLPIIIGLDVTGSMGHVPEALIKKDFPEVMKKILDEGVPCPQLCFTAYGDHECDDFPLQVGQFEASDELMEKWLTSIYLEGGGGGNGGESTSLVYYFAACHTSCDAISKRGKKGLVITIGDEPNLPDYPKSALKEIFGGAEKDLTSAEIISMATKDWEVYHINILDYAGKMKITSNCWKELLGDHFISVEANSDTNISNMIAQIAVEHYKKQNSTSASTATSSSDSNYRPPQML
ncbi:MAG: hypothetical protein IIU11_09980 [Bacteroidales bacterium]|jgi:hypothetical protein|nr:hypothetical protein [Bacteroidales bacterium]MBR6279495.1 hypothetical protein [Bacteroidales bacterium]